jgi:hypothetical protein
VLGCGPLQRAAAARWGRVQRAAQAVVTGEHEGRATGGRRENAVYSTYPLKSYRRRRLVGVKHRVVFGTQLAIEQVLATCGWTINTAFVEVRPVG